MANEIIEFIKNFKVSEGEFLIEILVSQRMYNKIAEGFHAATGKENTSIASRGLRILPKSVLPDDLAQLVYDNGRTEWIKITEI